MKTKKIKNINVIRPGSPPDVDTDFHTEGREKVVQYCIDKYGEENVANIITFNKFKTKTSFKSMCTIYSLPFALANKITGLLPPSIDGDELTLEDIFNQDHPRYSEGEDFRQATSSDEWSKIVKMAIPFDGRIRNTGVHACFVAGTSVKTKSGFKNIEDVQVGDMVLTHTNTYKEVVETMINDSDDLYLIRTSNSTPTEVTGKHPYFVREVSTENGRQIYGGPKWKNVEDLRKNKDVIGVPVNTKSELPRNGFDLPYNKKDFWWVIGRFLGSGWFEENSSTRNLKQKDGTPYIYQREEQNIIICVEKNDPTIDELRSKIGKFFVFTECEQKTVIKLKLRFNEALFSFLVSLGKYAHEKHITDEILNLPIELLKEFVDGYISADGSYDTKTGNIGFSTVSKDLFLGMIAAIHKVYNASVLTRFEKRDKMIIEGHEGQCRDRYMGSFHIETRQKAHSFYENGYIWSHIIEISPIEKSTKTYNLSVLDDNSYTANGVLVHNCGVIISKYPLSDTIPTQIRQDDGARVTQWTYAQCEELGLIKMDFLGLDTLDIIQNTVDNIKNSGKTPPNMKEIINGDMNDEKTFEMLREGKTVGTFQLGSTGVQELLKRAQPTEFMDIASVTALYRPGPMKMNAHNQYADRKNGREKVVYIRPEFAGTEIETILKPTYGLIIFQEQILQIATRFAGMTPYESDQLRKAIGKKKMKLMMSLRPKFINGITEKGFSEDAANELWDTIAVFGQYGFNKCLDENTIIDTENGSMSIKEYSELFKKNKHLRIKALNEYGQIILSKVKNVTNTGKKELYSLKTINGKSIKITDDHRLLTPFGYRTISDGGIKIGARLITEDEFINNDLYTPKKINKKQLKDNLSIVENQTIGYLNDRGYKIELVETEIDDNKITLIKLDEIYFVCDDKVIKSFVYKKILNEKFKNLIFITSLDMKDKVDWALLNNNIDLTELGDEIIEMGYPESDFNGNPLLSQTFDLEMQTEYPTNFIANGIVSHNSHSISYAINAYQTCYLKANYPAEFLAALLQQNTVNPDKIAMFIQEAKSMGLKIGTVDINLSQAIISATPDHPKFDILYGFSGIKQVNDTISKAIIDERNENGEYKTVSDFISRITKREKINSATIKYLALAGAFDSLNVSRKAVYDKAQQLSQIASKPQKQAMSLFDAVGDDSANLLTSIDLSSEEFSYNELIKNEAEAIGFFISGHPIDHAGPVSKTFNARTLSQLRGDLSSGVYSVLGTFTIIDSKVNRKGNRTIATRFDDGKDVFDSYLPKSIVEQIEKGTEIKRINKLKADGKHFEVGGNSKRANEILRIYYDDNIVPLFDFLPNDFYEVKIRKSMRNGASRLNIVDIKKIQTAHNGSVPYEIRLPELYNPKELDDLLTKHKGTTSILVQNNVEPYLMKKQVHLSREFIIELEKIIGKENIITKEI